jgi:chorismate--pyruvate lyase
MKLEQISSWNSYEAIEHELTNAEIKSWLLEQGPITKRIKSMKEFRLELIQDELSDVNEDEILFLNIHTKEIRVREVILYGNENPMVFARTIIPSTTIEKGLKELGTLGNKPLGDILFEKDIFSKNDIVFATFYDGKNLFWGRKIKYTVKDQPFSVMEVFLIK